MKRSLQGGLSEANPPKALCGCTGTTKNEGKTIINMETIIFRKPELKDGDAIYRLIKSSRPLDLNSRYSYLLLCSHFGETCIVAESDSAIVGFISAYIHPGQADTLFVLQVAVSSKVRNRGIATSILKKLLERPNLNAVSYIETTVTPSNRPSISFFRSFAEMLGTACIESVYFPEYLFGGNGHEEEILFRIGPISNPS